VRREVFVKFHAAETMGEREYCLALIKNLLISELVKDDRQLARVSICLGALEASLTSKTENCWPSGLEVIQTRF
jgi:hypothetical protein